MPLITCRVLEVEPGGGIAGAAVGTELVLTSRRGEATRVRVDADGAAAFHLDPGSYDVVARRQDRTLLQVTPARVAIRSLPGRHRLTFHVEAPATVEPPPDWIDLRDRFDRWRWNGWNGVEWFARGRPHVEAVRPTTVEPGGTVHVSGRNLVGARFTLAGRVAESSRDLLRGVALTMPRGLPTDRALDLSVVNVHGATIVRDAVTIVDVPSTPPPAADGPHTFVAPANGTLEQSGVGQRYLVLMVLPDGETSAAGLTAADLRADLEAKLVGPDPCADGFWREATYGKTSFDFEIHPDILDLPKRWRPDPADPADVAMLGDPDELRETFYIVDSAPLRIDATGAAYPVTFAAGDDLDVEGDGLSVTVAFPGGPMSLFAVITTINTAIDAAHGDPSTEAPFTAVSMGGQLRLQTTEDGAHVDLEVLGGSAVPVLGLDAATSLPGVDGFHTRNELFIDALLARVAGMDDADATSYLSQFAAVIVSHAVPDALTYFRANAGNRSLEVRGTTYEYGTIEITSGYPWEVFAHEIGHNLGLPDLYDEPGGMIAVGTELGRWDIMDTSWNDVHPSAWIKASRSTARAEAGTEAPWMEAADVLTVDPPPAGGTVTREVLVLPHSVPVPSINPFAASHPGVRLVHGVRLRMQPNHDIYVEARHTGPFSHPTLGDAVYDTAIPGDGIIVTDGVDDMSDIPIFRKHATLLTPSNDPLDIVGEDHVELLTPTNSLTIRCVELIGTSPVVYRVEITWGTGEFADLRITPWSPPPWETPDIWVDNEVDNEWDEYSRSDPAANPDVPGNPVGNGDRSRARFTNRVYARVWNDGTAAAQDVEVDFRVVKPAGSGPGLPIGSDTIPTIAPKSFGLATVEWVPRDTNNEHVCIKASIRPQADELNVNNNWAQENITDWFLESSSPYEPVPFRFQLTNPLDAQADVILEANGVRAGYSITVDRTELQLGPRETYFGVATIEAEDWVPLEQPGEVDPPLLTLSWSLLHGDTWVPFGGVSGVAHTVERVEAEMGIERIDDDSVELFVTASAGSGPVADRNVTARLYDQMGTPITTTRGRTDADGVARIRLQRPAEHAEDHPFELEVFVSPGVATGPADVPSQTLRFTDR